MKDASAQRGDGRKGGGGGKGLEERGVIEFMRRWNK